VWGIGVGHRRGASARGIGVGHRRGASVRGIGGAAPWNGESFSQLPEEVASLLGVSPRCRLPPDRELSWDKVPKLEILAPHGGASCNAGLQFGASQRKTALRTAPLMAEACNW
jgi:hypothetical protein